MSVSKYYMLYKHSNENNIYQTKEQTFIIKRVTFAYFLSLENNVKTCLLILIPTINIAL